MIKYIITALAINTFANPIEMKLKFDNILRNSQIVLVSNGIKILMQRQNDLEQIRESCAKQLFESEKQQEKLQILLNLMELHKKESPNVEFSFQALIDKETYSLDFIKLYIQVFCQISCHEGKTKVASSESLFVMSFSEKIFDEDISLDKKRLDAKIALSKKICDEKRISEEKLKNINIIINDQGTTLIIHEDFEEQ
jgi:hypothetical protein